jgi:hypothetical protein
MKYGLFVLGCKIPQELDALKWKAIGRRRDMKRRTFESKCCGSYLGLFHPISFGQSTYDKVCSASSTQRKTGRLYRILIGYPQENKPNGKLKQMRG